MSTVARAPSRAASEAGVGLAEALAVWALLGIFAGAIFWTYARLPARDFFHVSTSGPAGGAGRAVVFLNFPVALVAIAIVLIAVDRLRGRLAATAAVVAIALCAAVYWPGVVDQSDLDARWVNAIAAVGVALALALTLAAARDGAALVRRAPGDGLRLVLGVLVVIFALEYVTGEFGVFVNRIPGLGSLFLARELRGTFGYVTLRPAVHVGHHHGFDGALLALSALTLSRVLGTLRHRRLQVFLGLYLALMLAYGLANEVQDAWGEQLVKRGWIDWAIPSLIVPAASPAFAAVIGSGLLLWMLVFRRIRVPPGPPGRRLPALVLLLPTALLIVLAVLGATAGGRTVRTPLPSAAERAQLRAEGEMAFPMADESWNVQVAHGDGNGIRNLTPDDHHNLSPRLTSKGRLAFQSDRGGNADVYVDGHRVTADSHSDGEPAWSPDGRLIAFVSTRDGNREIYVMGANGREQRRLTHDGGNDEWPRWSNDGRIVFQSNRDGDYDLYEVGADGNGLRRLTDLPGDERMPAPSHRGSLVAFAWNEGHGYDLYLVGRDGTGLRHLTHDPGEDFGPAWSRDDRFLIFVSNVDGRDQLFVVRASGGALARLTGVQADKDAPDWR